MSISGTVCTDYELREGGYEWSREFWSTFFPDMGSAVRR